MFDRLFSHGSLHAGAHLGFFSGISLLLPVLGKAWSLHIKPWLYSPYGFYVAIALIVLSVVIIGFLAGSASKLLRSVGWLVIVPGILALVFTAFGETSVYGWAQNHVTGFVAMKPAVQVMVSHMVPTTAILGGFYVVIGVAFIWVGNRLSRIARFI